MNVIIQSIFIFVAYGCVVEGKRKAKAYIFEAADLIDGATPKKIGYIEFIEAGDMVIVRFFHLKRMKGAIRVGEGSRLFMARLVSIG